MRYLPRKMIEYIISFSCFHSISPDSNPLHTSHGHAQNKAPPESSPQPSPSSPSSPPNLNPPPASRNVHDKEIPVGSNSTVYDPPMDKPAAGDKSNKSPGLPSAADTETAEKDFKRVGKMAYNATLGVIAVSVTLLMSIPHEIHPDRLTLYAGTATLASLSLMISLGLIYYSISNPVGKKLAWVQERVMVLYCALVLLAVFSRMAAIFSLLHFLFMLLSAVVVVGLVILCLYFGWQAEKKIQ